MNLNNDNGSRGTAIAIVGMDVLLPGAPGLDAYWRNLRDGVDAISDLPEGRWDERFYAPEGNPTGDPERVYCRRGGFVDELADVEVTKFGIMPRSVPGTEPDQLIALHVAANAIADAGGEGWLPDDRDRVGVVLGRGGYLTPGVAKLDQRLRTAHQLVQTLGELLPGLDEATAQQVRQAFTDQLGPHEPEAAIGLVPNLAASRVANRLDLRGPAYTVDAACASSLVAVDNAIMELDSGRCDVVLAGGVHHCHDITLWSVFAQLGALSPTQRISPLDRAADGILIGEGTGVVVLKRLADAERDGDRVYAVIRGSGVTSDGRSASLMNPDPGGQVRAVRQAWRMAGLDPTVPGALGLLEAHGTATPAGDGAELRTVAEVFGAAASGETRIPIGSVKSMIGHAMPAAGVASLVKAALAVHYATLPPTLNCADPHPALRDTRFAPIDRARDWATHPGQPVRRAGINAFGFGGINAHLLIEQAPGATAVLPVPRVSTVDEPERVLRLAADSVAELAGMLAADDAELLAHNENPGSGPVRLGIVAPTPKRLALARKTIAKGNAWRGRSDTWFTQRPLLGAGGGRLAFVFPGLEAEFEPNTDDIAELFGLRNLSTSDDHAGHVAKHAADVVTLGRLLHAALRRMNVTADGVAGHSVGEWTGMACAGFVPDTEVEAMLDEFDPATVQVPGLTFAVLGTPAERVEQAIAATPDVVLSHDNAPNQAMICGPEEPVRALVEQFRAAGVLGQVLPFQSGFHTPMLAPYLDGIRATTDRFSLTAPTVPMYSATTAAPYPVEPDAVRALFVRHLLEPVRFRPMIEAMHAAGYTAFVQLGFGQLGSLIGDTLRGKEHLVVAASSGKHNGLAQLRRVATALWVDGLDPLSPEDAVRPAGAGHTVRLDLGGSLVSLPSESLPTLTLPTAPQPGTAHTTPLDHLAHRSEIAAELAATLRETAESAAAVLAAQANAPQPATALPPPPPRDELHGVLSVSTATMPYLLDHCFFEQRDDWPEVADRFPVVPGTTLIAQLAEVSEQLRPGTHPVAVRDVALNRWLAAETPVDVPIAAKATDGPHGTTVAAEVTGYCTATVELATAYQPPPAVWTFNPADERVPELAAAELYSKRWMFHGPRYRGVTELTAIGERHVRGVLRTPEGPGSLLDNVGQLLGYWIMSSHTHRTVVFPIGMREIRFHGPHPETGTELDCLIKITGLSETTLRADMQLVRNGVVWAEITGWADRRFDNDPVTSAVDRDIRNNTLSEAQQGNWELTLERWPNLSSRELILRANTNSIERADYDARPPTARRHWVLGRIAAKDAVRRWLWARGAGPVFPAEILVTNEADGAPRVSGLHRDLPELRVSVAHCREAGVAIVRPAGECAGVGIDIEEITAPSDGALFMAMGDEERALLHQVAAQVSTVDTDGADNAALWFTRFWAAKEAVAKANGTGLEHRPRAFAVVTARDDELRVHAPDGEHTVHVSTVSNPAGYTPRSYVVAWTETGVNSER